MKRKIIHSLDNQLGRLHCDNPACGYDLPVAHIWGPHLIGYRCPLCGSNMLTAADYAKATRVLKIIDWLNRWFGWLGTEKPPVAGGKTVRFTVRDGDFVIRDE